MQLERIASDFRSLCLRVIFCEKPLPTFSHHALSRCATDRDHAVYTVELPLKRYARACVRHTPISRQLQATAGLSGDATGSGGGTIRIHWDQRVGSGGAEALRGHWHRSVQ